MEIPAHYRGREQAFIKHQLLEAYLERLFMILGQYHGTIAYVDCFAGPWDEGTEDLSDTSIAISLRIMKKCREGLKKTFNRDVRFKAFYIEIKPDAFTKLEGYLRQNQSEGITTEARQGDFLALRDTILKWCGSIFTFFFIDPTGWQEIQITHLKPLLVRPNSEHLINFMYDYISRFCQHDSLADQFSGMFGSPPDVSNLPPEEREHRLLTLYCDNARKHTGRDSFFGRVNVLDPRADRTKYHLVYITRHPLGMVKFIEASEAVEVIQRNVRLQAKMEKVVERSGQGEFFTTEEVRPSDQKSEVRDSKTLEAAKEYWLKKLTKEPRRFAVPELARMLDETGWFIGDLQLAFKELAAAGKVQNLDAARTRPKNAVNFTKGERLILS